MKTYLKINEESFPIGTENLSVAVLTIPDTPDNQQLFDHLANHPSEKIRETVASKENLGLSAFESLLESNSPDIIARALRSPHLSEKHVQRLLASHNSSILRIVVENDPQQVFECLSREDGLSLLTRSNVDVRLSLAQTAATPKRLLRVLTEDDDADVRANAKICLDRGW